MRFFFALGVAVAPLLAQTPTSTTIDNQLHGWISYNGDHDLVGRWGVHFDGQFRRDHLFNRWQQYQLRPGLNFRANPNLLFTLGYVFTKTFPYGEFPVRAGFGEHRIYEQAIIRHPGRRVTFVQRHRLEQRFVQYPQNNGAYTYQNRYRFLFKAEAPVVRNTDGSPRWYLAVFDEIVLGIPPNYGARIFDQNRVFGGIGRVLRPYGNFEIGYLKQTLGQRNGFVWEFNHTLFLSFSSNYPFQLRRGARK